MKKLIALGFVSLFSVSAANAQINTINSVVFGSRIPLYLADPTGGMPVRNTAADFLSVVPYIAGARVVTFSPCSDAFITASGNTASLWQASNGQQNMALQHGSPIKFVGYGSDGTYAITSGGNYTRIWTAPRGEFRFQFVHRGEVSQLTVSPDGQRLAVVMPSGFEVWSLKEGVNLLRTPVENSIRQFMFNPNNKQFLTLDGVTATLWNAADGQPIGTIRPSENIQAAVFSPDGSKLVVACEGMTHIWDTKEFIKIADVQLGGGYR